MKKFGKPVLTLLKLEKESIMTGSLCFETFACKECYCEVVQCGGKFECPGLVCPSLSDFD